MKELVPGVYQWSRFSEEKQLYFNGHLVVSSGKRFLIDPPLMTDEECADVARLGTIDAILLTNRDHVREAEQYRAALKTKVLAPALDAPLMELQADGTFTHEDQLTDELRVIHIPDSKSPGESAFLLERDGGTLILGDALIGAPAGSLRLLPPDKFSDPLKAKAGLNVLLGYTYDTVLVGDGASLMSGGKEAIHQVIKERS